MGPLLLLFGLAITPLLKSLPSGRFGELIALGLLIGALAWLLGRLRGWYMASGLALIWILLLPVFTGVLPMLATILLLLAALVTGQALFAQRALALQATAGLLVLAAVLGWTLLLPIHSRWVYLPVCFALVIWRRALLWTSLRSGIVQWRRCVTEAPRSAALAVLLVGFASTACWLPTLQYDDLTYHLRLPWQLLQQGVYQPAPQHQIWALAPWATDVIQAVPQVIAGTESRGPVNAFWLILLATAAWQLAAQLGANVQLRWLAVGMVASLPLTAGLAGGMQTELPTAAVLLWMCALAASPRDGRLSSWLLLAVLAGGLLAMKSMSAVMALPVLVWALVRHPWPSLPRIGLVLLTGLLIGLANYVHAQWLAGNPVLPLLNGIFQSPYFAPTNFIDPKYKIGFGPGLPWTLTFHSSRYFESHDGAAGVVLVGLAGLWLLALLRPATRPAAWVTLAVLALPLLPIQYLRYAYPGMALLCVVAVAALGPRLTRRPVIGMLVALCVLNVSYQSTGYWMLRSGALKDTLKSAGHDAPLFQRFAPERSLAASIRTSGEDEGTVLLLDPRDSFFAEFGTRGRTVSWYSPALQSAASLAELDPSGGQWHQLLQEQQVRHIILRIETLTPSQRLALELAGARLREETGGRQWWSLPPAQEGSSR